MRADGMEKEMMLACGEGVRRRGRPTQWMEEIHGRTAMNLAQLRDAVRSVEEAGHGGR